MIDNVENDLTQGSTIVSDGGRNGKKHLSPFVHALMAFKHGKKFHTDQSTELRKRLEKVVEKDGRFAIPHTALFAGVSAVFNDTESSVAIAIAIRDPVYLLDYSVSTLHLSDDTSSERDVVAEHVIHEMERYAHENLSKFVGIGVPSMLTGKSPKLCSRLWLDLDVVPISITTEQEVNGVINDTRHWDKKCVDEQADSMARKCMIYFGLTLSPLLQVGYHGDVEIDAGFQAPILSVQDYRTTCGASTWEAMMKFVVSLKTKKTKIAFFSSTPQGGGVALMRHALVRLAVLLGVDLSWYVPKPKPGVFRITKNIHNILQGVSDPTERISSADMDVVSSWIVDNANRSWLSPGGPLRPPEEGGADVIMIDDPQMPGLIPLIKKVTPNRPVLYRSHIQIRSDLVSQTGSPQAEVWEYLWSNIRHADMFISHPIPSFVPSNVPKEKVAYLPATTDWLDGLNKDINQWNQSYYGSLYNEQCHAVRMTELKWPIKKYIIQIARFDPAKGIPDVLASYAEFRRLLAIHSPDQESQAPQLVICGHGSVDDPDGTRVYEQTLLDIHTKYKHLTSSISAMRLPPTDQLLDTLLSASHICLQLSTREGFEVKVSEALHKGIPVIATSCGGIPLQVQHGKNGFLVDAGDSMAVASHLLTLWTNGKIYKDMSDYAKHSVSDEVGTVGNALSWFYLADVWSGREGKGIVPKEQWVNDLARDAAGIPYGKMENRLPRNFA